MTPIEVYSHYSIQESYCHIDTLIEKAKELGIKSLALTDINSVSGFVEFFQECEKAKIRPILGMTTYIMDNLSQKHKVQLICQNKNGYHNLLKIISKLTLIAENKFVSENVLKNYSDNLILIAYDDYAYYNLKSVFKHSFKRDEIQGSPIYYINKSDRLYQQLIICSKFKTTFKHKEVFLLQNPEYNKFFDENIPLSLEEFAVGNYNNDHILQLISDFSIKSKPHLPKIVQDNPDEVLTNLCRQGWKSRNIEEKTKNNPEMRQQYINRIKKELAVFKTANLANYLLVIHDVVKFCRDNKQHCGLRGSAVGCLTSYLIGIDDVDPICPDPTVPWDKNKELLFERFYNSGRNSLPGIYFKEGSYDEFLLKNI